MATRAQQVAAILSDHTELLESGVEARLAVLGALSAAVFAAGDEAVTKAWAAARAPLPAASACDAARFTTCLQEFGCGTSDARMMLAGILTATSLSRAPRAAIVEAARGDAAVGGGAQALALLRDARTAFSATRVGLLSMNGILDAVDVLVSLVEGREAVAARLTTTELRALLVLAATACGGAPQMRAALAAARDAQHALSSRLGAARHADLAFVETADGLDADEAEAVVALKASNIQSAGEFTEVLTFGFVAILVDAIGRSLDAPAATRAAPRESPLRHIPLASTIGESLHRARLVLRANVVGASAALAWAASLRAATPVHEPWGRLFEAGVTFTVLQRFAVARGVGGTPISGASSGAGIAAAPVTQTPSYDELVAESRRKGLQIHELQQKLAQAKPTTKGKRY